MSLNENNDTNESKNQGFFIFLVNDFVSFREYRFIVSNAIVATSGIDGTFDCDPEIPLASHNHSLRFLHIARIFFMPNFQTVHISNIWISVLR